MRVALATAILLLAFTLARSQDVYTSPAYYPYEEEVSLNWAPGASLAPVKPNTWWHKHKRSFGIVGWNIVSSTIGALGDAIRDDGNDWGWALNGVEAAMWGSAHWVHGLRDWNEHLYYYASATFIRAGVFDITYNLKRGLPWHYTGTKKMWDRAWNELNPPPQGKGIFYGWAFTLGVAIPLNEF